MPNWDVQASTYDIPRNLALLDTNVLIAFIDTTDSRHDHTQAVIDMAEYRWAVAQPNLIEAWNFLVGKQKRRDLAYKLMDWVLTPGQVILLDDSLEPIVDTHRYSREMSVDIVDAGMINLADRISKYCGLRPAVHVATYDTRDFYRLFGHNGLEFNVYDLEHTSSTTGY